MNEEKKEFESFSIMRQLMISPTLVPMCARTLWSRGENNMFSRPWVQLWDQDIKLKLNIWTKIRKKERKHVTNR